MGANRRFSEPPHGQLGRVRQPVAQMAHDQPLPTTGEGVIIAPKPTEIGGVSVEIRGWMPCLLM